MANIELRIDTALFSQMETLEEKSNLLALQADNNMEQPFTVSSLVCIAKKCFSG